MTDAATTIDNLLQTIDQQRNTINRLMDDNLSAELLLHELLIRYGKEQATQFSLVAQIHELHAVLFNKIHDARTQPTPHPGINMMWVRRNGKRMAACIIQNEQQINQLSQQFVQNQLAQIGEIEGKS